MKAKIHNLLILILLWLPHYANALEQKQGAFATDSFQQAQQQQILTAGDNSQNSIPFFSARLHPNDDVFGDVDVDDDDVSFSTRKRISFEKAACIDAAHYTFRAFGNHPPRKYQPPYFYHLSPSHFIALRVFRI